MKNLVGHTEKGIDMIGKNDLLLLLADLEDKGIDTKRQSLQVLRSDEIDLGVLKFINDNRQMDLSRFYEKLRKSYNEKKSKLYVSIVKEIEDPTDVLTTLASMNLQILLFLKTVPDKDKKMFIKFSRAEEIVQVLENYYKTYDITNCIRLLRVIKSDLKALESIR